MHSGVATVKRREIRAGIIVGLRRPSAGVILLLLQETFQVQPIPGGTGVRRLELIPDADRSRSFRCRRHAHGLGGVVEADRLKIAHRILVPIECLQFVVGWTFAHRRAQQQFQGGQFPWLRCGFLQGRVELKAPTKQMMPKFKVQSCQIND